ncbi:MAG: GNAT family N-acetyltransferase [Pseudonocardiaceae bacterium]
MASSLWRGRVVRLRGLEPADAEAIAELDLETDDQRAADRVQPPRSHAGYRRWAEQHAHPDPGADEFQLAIESLRSGQLVGTIRTHSTNAVDGRFGYDVAVGRPFQRHGYATDAIRILLRFMFTERRYQKCEAAAYAFSAPSLALHRRLGFVEEGRLRRHHFAAAAYQDVVLFGLTAEEFLAGQGR